MENKGNRMTFDRKGYGRIFAEKEEDIQKIKDIIKEIDEYEFDYLPNELITVFSEDNMKAVYTHKFCDLDMQLLTRICWERGVRMFVWYGRVNGYEDI